jgi:hypothetical protein
MEDADDALGIQLGQIYSQGVSPEMDIPQHAQCAVLIFDRWSGNASAEAIPLMRNAHQSQEVSKTRLSSE